MAYTLYRESNLTSFSEAIRNDDMTMTKWFLRNGANPNAGCTLDYTPLSAAVLSASIPTIELLFSNGGLVEHGQLLHFAASRRRPDRLQVLEFLLSKGANGMNSLLYENRPDNFDLLK